MGTPTANELALSTNENLKRDGMHPAGLEPSDADNFYASNRLGSLAKTIAQEKRRRRAIKPIKPSPAANIA